MASVSRITKEDIVKAGFEIIREKGIDRVNAREVASKLNSSVQPIFYRFTNMEELKQELLAYSLEYYRNFILNFKGDTPKYRQIGLNYIQFAKKESYLFKFIFMGEYQIKIEEFSFFDKSYNEVEKTLQIQNKLSPELAKKFHLKMWLFVHGISCLIASNTCIFSDEEIGKLLAEEFQILRKSLNEDKKENFEEKNQCGKT